MEGYIINQNGKQVRIGIVRVITTTNKEFLESHGKLIKEYFNDNTLVVQSDCIIGFPEGLHTEEDEIKSIPNIVQTGKSLKEQFNVDTLIVSCAADPGVKELQKEVQIPVIGAGSAVASLALLIGKPVGVLGISDNPPRIISSMLQNQLVAYTKPEEVETTLDINKAINTYIDLAKDLVAKKDVETILLACTGFSTARIAPTIEEAVNKIVIDPVIASGIIAYYTARGNSF
ncbi:MAG: aspartate/glutamate racemase family protein [Candidatus Heimdallarchaeota archaeon]